MFGRNYWLYTGGQCSHVFFVYLCLRDRSQIHSKKYSTNRLLINRKMDVVNTWKKCSITSRLPRFRTPSATGHGMGVTWFKIPGLCRKYSNSSEEAMLIIGRNGLLSLRHVSRSWTLPWRGSKMIIYRDGISRLSTFKVIWVKHRLIYEYIHKHSSDYPLSDGTDEIIKEIIKYIMATRFAHVCHRVGDHTV